MIGECAAAPSLVSEFAPNVMNAIGLLFLDNNIMLSPINILIFDLQYLCSPNPATSTCYYSHAH